MFFEDLRFVRSRQNKYDYFMVYGFSPIITFSHLIDMVKTSYNQNILFATIDVLYKVVFYGLRKLST